MRQGGPEHGDCGKAARSVRVRVDFLAEQFLATCRNAVAGMVGDAGQPDPALLEVHQLAAHGFAWQATYVEALRQALRWAHGLHETGTLSAVECAILRLGFAEFWRSLAVASQSARPR